MKKVIAFAILSILFLVPLILIGSVSYLEMKKYEPESNVQIIEKSYGEPLSIARMTMKETINLSGKFISDSFVFVNLDNKNNETIKMIAKPNKEIKKDEVLAYINNKPIYSTVNGIVSEIELQSNGYIKILNIDNLLFECFINPSVQLNQEEIYNTDNDSKLQLISVSNIASELGIKAYFKVSGKEFLYGETADFILYTGIIYNDVLVVNKNCIYQKEKGGSFYIRRVNADRVVIGEVPVEIGIENNNYICVSGVEEGWYCDSGYANFIYGEIN